MRTGLLLTLSLVMASACASDALAQTTQLQCPPPTAQIPRCVQPLGVLAVEQPQRDWWTQLHLGSPEALFRVFVQDSGCFTQVDRGAGLAAAERERALASAGHLEQGSNIGGGQIEARHSPISRDCHCPISARQ